MATKWYFRDTNASTGPTGELSTDTDNFTSVPADKNTPKDMSATIGAGQTSSAGLYNNAGATKLTMVRMFVSPALAAQTLSGGLTYTIGFGRKESNTSMNMFLRYFVYVWRSGNVKTIIVPTSDPTEEGILESGCVHDFTGEAGDYSLQDEDRIVLEAWFDLQNTKSTDYTATLYYDGTTDVLENTTTSDAAAYISINSDLILMPTGAIENLRPTFTHDLLSTNPYFKMITCKTIEVI